MGRPSKLPDAKWEELKTRLARGEKAADLAREYKVSKTAISVRVSKRAETVKVVANQLVEADAALRAMPVSDQALTLSLVDELKAISMHLAGAGKLSAATAHRLTVIAHDHVQKIDDADPTGKGSEASLLAVGKLTRLANEASSIPMNLLAANKDLVKVASKDAPVLPVRVVVEVEDASVPEAQ